MDTVLGRIVVERGLATAEEVQQCIEQQRMSSEESDPNPHSLGDLMVANDIITRRQIDRDGARILKVGPKDRQGRVGAGRHNLEEVGLNGQ